MDVGIVPNPKHGVALELHRMGLDRNSDEQSPTISIGCPYCRSQKTRFTDSVVVWRRADLIEIPLVPESEEPPKVTPDPDPTHRRELVFTLVCENGHDFTLGFSESMANGTAGFVVLYGDDAETWWKGADGDVEFPAFPETVGN